VPLLKPDWEMGGNL